MIREKERYTDEPNDPASEFVETLIKAKKIDAKLQLDLKSIQTQSWTSNLAKAVLDKLEGTIRDVLEDKIVAAVGLKEAIEKAVAAAVDFERDHPVWFTIIAIGVLVLVAPWVLELLGFGELGPIEGTFAALWQSRYAGYVPKQSLFSFLQRMGMVWKH